MHLCTKKLENIQSKNALKIIKYAFLANKKTNILCTKKFIIIHETKILYFYYLPSCFSIYYFFNKT